MILILLMVFNIFFILEKEIFVKENIINILSTIESLKQTYKDVKFTFSIPYSKDISNKLIQNPNENNENWDNIIFNDEQTEILASEYDKKEIDDLNKDFDIQNADFLQLGKTSFLKNNINLNIQKRILDNLDKNLLVINDLSKDIDQKNTSKNSFDIIDPYSTFNIDMSQLKLFNIL
jgi:hypothetical protein